jgi:hypothetical protein
MMKLTLMYNIKKFLQLVIKNIYSCPIHQKMSQPYLEGV